MISVTSATISPKTPRAIASGLITRCATASETDAVGEKSLGSPRGRIRAISVSTAVTLRDPPEICRKEIVGSTQQCSSGFVNAGVAKTVGLRAVSSTISPALVVTMPTTVTTSWNVGLNFWQFVVD